MFVSNERGNTVTVTDSETWKVIDEFDAGNRPRGILVGQRGWQMAFTPDGKHLITTNGNSNDVTVIDVEAQKAIRSIPVGQQPWGVAVRPIPSEDEFHDEGFGGSTRSAHPPGDGGPAL